MVCTSGPNEVLVQPLDPHDRCRQDAGGVGGSNARGSACEDTDGLADFESLCRMKGGGSRGRGGNDDHRTRRYRDRCSARLRGFNKCTCKAKGGREGLGRGWGREVHWINES